MSYIKAVIDGLRDMRINEGVKGSKEGTDVSGVSTPTGVVGEIIKKKEPVCPKCKSHNVNVRDGAMYHCCDCDNEWDASKPINSEDEGKVPEIDPFKGLKKVKDPSKGKTLPDGYAGDGMGNVYKIPTTGYSKSYKYKNYDVRYNYKTREIEFMSGKELVHSVGLSAGDWFDGPGYWIGYAYKDLKDSIGYEFANESVEYEVGKRYKSIDGIYLTIKSENEDGTYTVYDEETDEEYDCDLSDLEALHLELG